MSTSNGPTNPVPKPEVYIGQQWKRRECGTTFGVTGTNVPGPGPGVVVSLRDVRTGKDSWTMDYFLRDFYTQVGGTR